MWLWVFGSATELVVLHLILPWERVRLVVDIVSAWGLLWMVGSLAAYRIRPHLLLGDRLCIRSGVYHDIVVPLDAIAGAFAREADLPSSVFPLQVAPAEAGDQLSLGVSGRTSVRFWLDEASRFVERLNDAVASTPGVSRSA